MNFSTAETRIDNHPDMRHVCLSLIGKENPMTPKEKKYLRTMADLGEGPHRSGDIAARFDAVVSSLAPTRSSLISKGMIWSPNHGDTAFTVPMFDQFMKRIMPGDDWR